MAAALVASATYGLLGVSVAHTIVRAVTAGRHAPDRVAAERDSRCPRCFSGARRMLARIGLIGVLAACEEVTWRWVVLGGLLRWGPAAAWAGSTLGFALGHRARPAAHLATGASFGSLYLATGRLSASICAHWSYNLLVAAPATRSTAIGGRR